MFLRLETQWRPGFNNAPGIDYGAARWLFDLYKVEDAVSLLESLQIMERAAIAALAERAEQ